VIVDIVPTDATSHKRKLMSLLQVSMEPLWRGLMLSWKAQCGESRMLLLERGKGCEALPIATIGHCLSH
jgi:hypothetical protein